MSLWVLPFWDRPAQSVILVLNSQELPHSVNFLLVWGAKAGEPDRLLGDIAVKPVSTRGSSILETVTPFVMVPALDDNVFTLYIEAWSRTGREADVPFTFVATGKEAPAPHGPSQGMVLDPTRLSDLQSPFSTESIATMLLPQGMTHLSAGDEARIEEARRHGGTVVLSPTAGGRIGPMVERAGPQDTLRAGFVAAEIEDRSNPWAGEGLEIWVDLGTDPQRAQELDKRLVFGFERYADPADVQSGRRTIEKIFGNRPAFLLAQDSDPRADCVRRLDQMAASPNGSSKSGASHWVARCAFRGLAHLDRAFVLHAGGARLYLDQIDGEHVSAPIQSFVFMGRRAVRDSESGEAILGAFRQARPATFDAGADRQGTAGGGGGFDLTLPGQSLLTETAYAVLAGRLTSPDSDASLTQNFIPTLRGLGIDFQRAASVVRECEAVFALLLRDVRARVRYALDHGGHRLPQDHPLTCMDLMAFGLSAQDPGAGRWVSRLEGDDMLAAWTAFRTGQDMVPFIRVGIPYDASLSQAQRQDLEILAGLMKLDGLEPAVDRFLGETRSAGGRGVNTLEGLASRCRRIEDAFLAYRQDLETVIGTLPMGSMLRHHLMDTFLTGASSDDPVEAAQALIDGVRFADAFDGRLEKPSSLLPFDALAPIDAAALAQIGEDGSWSHLSDTVLTILERIYADWLARAEQVAGALKILASRLAMAFETDPVEGTFAEVLQHSFEMAEEAYRIGVNRPSKEPGGGLNTTVDRLSSAMGKLPPGFLDSEAGERLLAFVDFVLEHGEEVSSGLQTLLREKSARELQEESLAQVALTLGFPEAKTRSASDRDDLLKAMAIRLCETSADILKAVTRARNRSEGIRNQPREDMPASIVQWADDLETAAAAALDARQSAAPLTDALTRTTGLGEQESADPEAADGPQDTEYSFSRQDDEIVRRLTGSFRELTTLYDRLDGILDQFVADSPYKDQLLRTFKQEQWSDFHTTLEHHHYLMDGLNPQISAMKLDSPMVEDLSDLLLVYALDQPALAERVDIPGLFELSRLLDGQSNLTHDEMEVVQWELDRLRDVIAHDSGALNASDFLDRRRRDFRDKLRRVRERILLQRRSPAAEAMVPSISQVELVREGLKWWRAHYDTSVRPDGAAELDPDLKDALVAEKLLPPTAVDA